MPRPALLACVAVSLLAPSWAETAKQRAFVLERLCEVECRDAGPWADESFLRAISAARIRETIVAPGERPGVLLRDDRGRILVDSRRAPSALPVKTLTRAVEQSDAYFAALEELEHLSAEGRPERRAARQALGEIERALDLWEASRETLLPLLQDELASSLDDERRAWIETLVALNELDLGDSLSAARRLARLVRTYPGLEFREDQLRALAVAYRRSGRTERAAQVMARLREEFPEAAPMEDEPDDGYDGP